MVYAHLLSPINLKPIPQAVWLLMNFPLAKIHAELNNQVLNQFSASNSSLSTLKKQLAARNYNSSSQNSRAKQIH